jgi:hypothetical protein
MTRERENETPFAQNATLLRISTSRKEREAPPAPLRAGHGAPGCRSRAGHEQIGDPTIADGILDRLVHNAHRIEMRGESMRKKRNPPRENDEKKE